MKENKNTIFAFMIGIVSVIAFIPIIETIVELIISWIEVLKVVPVKMTLKGNREIQELQVDLEKVDDSVAIGFRYDGCDNNFIYDEDDFEDKMKK